MVCPENSPPPKLIDTALAPLATATSTACIRSVNGLLAASINRMLAAGAIACAHSTSSDVSSAHPASVRGVLPDAGNFVKHPFELVHEGSPNCLLNTARSDSIVGSS